MRPAGSPASQAAERRRRLRRGSATIRGTRYQKLPTALPSASNTISARTGPTIATIATSP